MYGSGARIGMVIIAVLPKLILLVHRVGLTALLAAPAVAARLSGAALPIAAAIPRTTAAAALSACASSSPSNMLGIPFII